MVRLKKEAEAGYVRDEAYAEIRSSLTAFKLDAASDAIKRFRDHPPANGQDDRSDQVDSWKIQVAELRADREATRALVLQAVEDEDAAAVVERGPRLLGYRTQRWRRTRRSPIFVRS